MQKISIIVTIFCLILFESCTRDQTDPEPPPCDSAFGYTQDIAPIIQSSCAYSGCHDGGTPGTTDYSSFDRLNVALDNGDFSRRVLSMRDMPPSYATAGPTMLNDNELEIIRMWVLAGAPEEASETEITYDSGISTLMETHCAYSGCHDGVPGGGAPRNYNFYDEILVHLENGKFVERVITLKNNPTLGMPPDDASGPKNFTQDELDMIKCWIEKGYPEN